MNRKIKFRLPAREDADGDRGDQWPAAGRHFSPTPRSMFGGSAGMRLLVLCLMLVMVLWAMSYAGRPENWNWLFKFNRVDLPAGEVAGADSEPPAGDFRQPADKDADSDRDSPDTQGFVSPSSSPDDLEQSFWRKVLRNLDGDDQVRLFTLIDCATKQSAAPVGATATLSPLWSRVRRWRRDMHLQWQESTGDVARFQPAVDRWSQTVVPAVRAVLEDRIDEALATEAMRDVARGLSVAATRLIEDRTPVGRPQEAYAWFSAWSEVFDQPIGEVQENPATVTQLLAQPDAYRGQNISVRGTALRVERVSASHNPLGIEQYHVVWIKPDHPSSFPWCLYTLVIPESLRCDPEEIMRSVEQPVTANGRFFKNRLFNAGGSSGQAAVAPLLMSATVEVPMETSVSRDRGFRMPGRLTIWLSLACIAGLAVLIARTVYRSTIGGRHRALPREEQLQKDFADLQQDQRVETVTDKLKRLGQAEVDDPQD